MGGGDPCNMINKAVNFYNLEHKDAFRQVLASIIAPIAKVDAVGSLAARSMFDSLYHDAISYDIKIFVFPKWRASSVHLKRRHAKSYRYYTVLFKRNAVRSDGAFS
jgi:hypothetical protein